MSKVINAPIASLLDVVRSFDGDKEAQFNVAFQAIQTAYTLALTHGNKTQLVAVIESTGKKRHEVAMRKAIQVVGALGLHKDAATRQETIDMHVKVAADLYAAQAFKSNAPKDATKAKPEAPAVQLTKAKAEIETLQRKLALATAQRSAAEAKAGGALDKQALVAYAASLPDAELAALADSLMSLIESRTTPQLQAA